MTQFILVCRFVCFGAIIFFFVWPGNGGKMALRNPAVYVLYLFCTHLSGKPYTFLKAECLMFGAGTLESVYEIDVRL